MQMETNNFWMVQLMKHFESNIKSGNVHTNDIANDELGLLDDDSSEKFLLLYILLVTDQ